MHRRDGLVGMRDFFSERKAHSMAKTSIAVKYFDAWSRIMVGQQTPKIAYVDLYCGKGRYDDGTESTPITILRHAISDPRLADRLVTLFNDINLGFVRSLEAEIQKLPDVFRLKYAPVVSHIEVGQELVRLLEQVKLVPSLVFIDPCGYKGLSLELLAAVLKDWGCECLFFFNYNRVMIDLRNRLVRKHMVALFGEKAYQRISEETRDLAAARKEAAIIKELEHRVRDVGGKYVVPFRLVEHGRRDRHYYLVFATKNSTGHKIMRDIMAGASSSSEGGVASFEYNLVTEQQLALPYDRANPLEQLAQDLLQHFAGRTLSVEQVFNEHAAGTTFVLRNYREALKWLEGENRVAVSPPPSNPRVRRRGTLPPDFLVTFQAAVSRST